MRWKICVAVWLGAFLLCACEPPSNAGDAQYRYHKSNRESYLYQGL